MTDVGSLRRSRHRISRIVVLRKRAAHHHHSSWYGSRQVYEIGRLPRACLGFIEGSASRFSANLPRAYLKLSAPALAHWLSCALVMPETPIAPTILPSLTSGIPPSAATTPGNVRMRRFSPPVASASRNAFVGRLNVAAVRAFSAATCALASCVLS